MLTNTVGAQNTFSPKEDAISENYQATSDKVHFFKGLNTFQILFLLAKLLKGV